MDHMYALEGKSRRRHVSYKDDTYVHETTVGTATRGVISAPNNRRGSRHFHIV